MRGFVQVGWLLRVAALLALASAPAAATQDGLRPWTEYRTILWIGDSIHRRPEKMSLFMERLAELGINTGMVHGDASPQFLLDARLPYYVENLVNRGLCLKWNATVSDWDRFVTTWARTGRPESAFLREYGLEDPAWRQWARDQVQRIVRRHRPHRPLAYDLRDELSVTISANPFDYDFSPSTLRSFREWLKSQYPSLAALNAQWQTTFDTWEAVRPFSTDQIKHRMASGQAMPQGSPDWHALQPLRFDLATARPSPTRWNFSPWADFRTFMDLSLARALDDLRQAARALDPRTPVGIEGTQMPAAFGGYDLWRLSGVLDWVEPYDIGNAREIFGSFMPGKPILCTVGESETRAARRRLWHLLLEGDQGCIVWWSEDCIDWNSEPLALTAKARALAPVLQEMTSPLARVFLRAERESDPIAIHYSQPSIQANWLIESTADGSTWPRRFSSFEASHNRMARRRNAWLKAFQDLGFTPRFVASDEVAAGALRRRGDQAFVMPESLALSASEADAVRDFLRDGTVFCDGTPGVFDEHGRLRARSPLEDLFPAALSASRSYARRSSQPTATREGDSARYASARLESEPDLGWARWVGDRLKPLTPPVQVPLETRTRVHRFRAGRARLVAFERNINYEMSETLEQAGGNQHLERAVPVEARFREAADIYDLRAVRWLGRTNQVTFVLDPWQPTLLAWLPERIPAERVMDTLLPERGTSPADSQAPAR
jgi:hypothetical protein